MSVAWVGAGISAVGVIGGMASGKKAQKSADAAAAAQLQLQQQQQDIANEQWKTYKDTYQPLEQGMVKDAQNFDTPEAREQAASQAQAVTAQQIGLAQERLTRTPGLDPTSGAAQAAQTKLALSGAALGATNQNAARTQVRDAAWARKMDALGLGKGLVTNATAGLANANASAGSIAATQQANATSQATNTAAAITGLGNQFVNAYKTSQAAKAPAGVSLPASSLPTPVFQGANTDPIPGI